ncbi:MAG: hypothetical protein ACRDNP_08370 [Gaiellaceae bacterium]
MIALVGDHPGVREIRLVGSRAEGRANDRSDWDFRVDARDFGAVADALPLLLEPLDPLAQQWDRLSPEHCWMLMLHGPVKVDLIFPKEPHAIEPPWEVSAETIDGIDAHFWDWMLWLSSKDAAGRREVVAAELEKLFDHLLAPLEVDRPPSSIAQAVAAYREGRARVERRLGVAVSRDLENAVAPS